MRIENELSYQKLHDKIKEKCNINISADSLSNYEVDVTQNHSRAEKCKGMKIEFLRALSSFYGVSTDWLLGISDTRSRDDGIKSIVESSGLSEFSAESLVSARKMVSQQQEPKDILKFKKLYNIPDFVDVDSLFITCLAIPDFIDSVIAALTENETLLAQITTAFSLWFTTFPEVDISEASLDEGSAFINKNRIAIDRKDFLKLCTYEIANSIANTLSQHYSKDPDEHL